MIAAMVAVYPLHSDSTRAIHRAIDSIRSAGIDVNVGSMSTLITGTADEVFHALRRAYEAAASTGRVVVHATVSNACPVSPRGSPRSTPT
jgi:uncharacterized protein YqgV (UPF0045/DUF77 family)